jgi:hypothetical protein
MASTYSNLKVELIGTGEQSGTWGTTTNTNLGTALEEAIVASVDIPFSSSDVTLTLTDTNASQSARHFRLNLTGTSGGARNLILGSGCQIEKPYLVNNGLADAVTVKNTTGTGIAVPAGKTMLVYNNGTDVVDAVTHLSSLTLSTALPIASGGTGSTTDSGARTNLGATTVGSSFFTLTNPSAIRFPRINADNTVSALTDSDFRTAIGAGTGTGTVTSVATGTGLTGGTITTSGTVSVATNGITDALLRQSAGLSLIGRSTNTTGNVADITAALDGQVLRRSGTAIGFGAVDLSSANAVTGDLPYSNLAQATKLTVLGNPVNATGDLSAISAGTNGQVLRRASDTLGFGAIDLASASAVSGILAEANGGTGISSFGTGIATWLGTPSSANLAAAVTDETGSGALVFATTPLIIGLREESAAIAASDINLSLGNYFTRTISGTTTFTVSNIAPSGDVSAFILILTNGGSATVNWFSGVTWAGGTPPTLTTSGVDIIGFFTINAGTTWRGLLLAKDIK